MINTEKEALLYFADILICGMENNVFSKCCLEMKKQVNSTGFCAYYIDEFDMEKSIVPKNGHELCTAIRELYTITQTQPPIHKDWNKAVFTLYPDGKVNMEYIFDAEWQAEVDADAAKIRAAQKLPDPLCMAIPQGSQVGS